MNVGLSQQIEEVQKNIAEAAQKSKRNYRDIKLVAVTKTITLEIIKEAFAAGLTDFGENRVQELLGKYEEIPGAKWHLIGHLQRNKVKHILDKVVLVHSLDSIQLAREISDRATAKGLNINALVQVNVAEEDTKFGIGANEVQDFLEEVSGYPGLTLKGLMTVAPYSSDPEEIRFVFRELKEKYDFLKSLGVPKLELEILSMGMSNDYKVAIEEGSNLVRIGSNIFGARI